MAGTESGKRVVFWRVTIASAAAILIITAAGLGVWAKFGRSYHMTASETVRLNWGELHSLAFADSQTLVGAYIGPSQVMIVRWHVGRQQTDAYIDLDKVAACGLAGEKVSQYFDKPLRIPKAAPPVAPKAARPNPAALQPPGRRVAISDDGYFVAHGSGGCVEILGPRSSIAQSALSSDAIDVAFAGRDSIVVLQADGTVTQFRFAPGKRAADKVGTVLQQPELVPAATVRLNAAARLWKLDGAVAALDGDSAYVFSARGEMSVRPLRGPQAPEPAGLAISPAGTLAILRDRRIFMQGLSGSAWETYDASSSSDGIARALAFIDDTTLAGMGRNSLQVLAVPEGGRARPIAAFTLPLAAERLVTSAQYLAVSGREGTVVFAHRFYTATNWVGWLALLAALFLDVSGAALWHTARRLLQTVEPPEGISHAAEPLRRLELPAADAPEALTEALRHGECVLFAGPGLAASAGWPDDRRLAEVLLERLEANRLSMAAVASDSGDLTTKQTAEGSPRMAQAPAEAVRTIREGLSKGRPEIILERAAQLLGDAGTRAALRDIAAPLRPSALHQALARLPFSAVITTGHDRLLEAAFPGVPVLNPQDSSLKERLFKSTEPFILPLHGSPEVSGASIALNAGQFLESLGGNLPLTGFFDALFASRLVFFVGFDFSSVETYARRLMRFAGQRKTGHFALVAVQDSGWKAEADYAVERFNLHLIPVAADEWIKEGSEFLRKLRSAASERGPSPASVQSAAPQRLASVRLQNIGPFEDLTLDLEPGWNILLGDNGVGKTTILKAIAAALLGRDAQPNAHRLLRVGFPQGSIRLETQDGGSFTTEILRTDSGVEVRSVTGKPTDFGLFALGFPPLRAISWARVAPGRVESVATPLPDDLLPLLSGEPDPRVDRLKQWIINLDYEVAKGNTTFAPVLDDFRQVASALATGMKLEFLDLKEGTMQVRTHDGDIPIEALSQGTGSLLSWVGIVLQRLYARYGERSAAPRREPAVVLMDEIDAHMHPAWQRGLVQRLTQAFPEVQFIASTHSPLIVGGLPATQVKRFVRNSAGRVVTAPLEDYMTLGRADQLLTGRLFGLDTTLDIETQKHIKRYKELLARRAKGLSDPDEPELRELERILEYRIPPPGETPVQQAQALVTAILESQLEQFPAARDKAREAASKLLDEVAHAEKFGRHA